MTRRRRYNGEDLFDVADLAELQGHPDCQPSDHALYQPLDPCRAAIPTHPLCAGSGLDRGRHRAGPDPYVIRHGDRQWQLCSRRCLALWVGAVAGVAS